MGFYENYEYILSERSLVIDSPTSDIIYNSNYNSSYLLSSLNDFFDKTHVEFTLMEDFNQEIYQRVVYENLLTFGEPDTRKSYTMVKNPPVNYEITFGYEYACEYNSIIPAGINCFQHYLDDKFEFFDFSVFNSKMERMEQFESFNFYLKMINLLDCTLYQEIQNSLENLYDMLEDMPIKDKIKRVKEKSFVAIIWNNLLSYLGKCDSDLQECFISQSWEFINKYITERI